MDVLKQLDCTRVEENDVVSRYVTRKLAPEEAEAFEEHYFGCDRCWSEVQRATELRAALGKSGAGVGETGRLVRGPWRTWAPLAAAAGIALAVGLGIYVASHRGDAVESLARAASTARYRTLEGRLAGRFGYLPAEPVQRGAEGPSLSLDLRRAALDAQKKAEENKSAETLRASALGHLLTGELDPAIAQLEEARKLDPGNVAIANDLAAASLTRARQKADAGEGKAATDDFDAALGAANAALEKDPKSPEALFNRALIVESQHLREDAADAWRKYLEVDGTSPWAAEARKHLEKAMAPTDSELWERERKSPGFSTLDEKQIEALARRFPQQLRVYVQDEVLPEWGRAHLGGNAIEATSRLEWASRAANALHALSGDSLLAESVEVIEMRSTEDLARAHSLYGEARSAYQRLAIPSALTSFESSKALLEKAGSPFDAQAAIGGVTCRLYRNELRPSLDALDHLLESQQSSSPERHSSLLAQAHWYRGFIRNALGYPHDAIEENRRSLAFFDRLGEKENSAALHGLLSEDFDYAGDEDSAWIHLDQAVALLDDLGPVPRRTVWLAGAARAHTSAEHRELASLFQIRLLGEAESTGRPDTIADALLSSAIAHYRGGRPRRAREDLVRARKALAAIPDRDVRRRIEANLDLSQITYADPGRSDGAIQRMTAALAFFQETENHLAESQLYLERGRMRIRQADPSGARTDFDSGIEEFEKQRSGLSDENLRIQYFDTGRRLFESQVQLLADRQDVPGSFLYADRAHARLLLDQLQAIPGRDAPTMQGPAADPLLRVNFPDLVPERTGVVEFLMLPDELIAWVAQRGRIEIVRTPLAEGRLQGLVRQLEGSREDRSSSMSTLGALREILIAPIEARILGLPHLVIVPDRDLYRVPFSALLDGRTGAQLVEAHDITIAPSAATFLHLRDRAPPLDSEPSILAIAGPATAPLPGLRRLEHADEECRRISSLYPRSLVLSSDRATRNAFRSAVPSFSVIHFAGHAVVNSIRPALSMLVLTPDREARDDGYLYSHELSSIDFRGVRLVVLGACSTAAGRTSASEGVLGLARSVLSAGVPSVVASLWPVDDATASALLTDFHTRLRTGESTASALRNAQLAVLEKEGSGASRLSSGAFQLYGTSINVTSERREE
jgi:CHAT domain-containing protein